MIEIENSIFFKGDEGQAKEENSEE